MLRARERPKQQLGTALLPSPSDLWGWGPGGVYSEWALTPKDQEALHWKGIRFCGLLTSSCFCFPTFHPICDLSPFPWLFCCVPCDQGLEDIHRACLRPRSRILAWAGQWFSALAAQWNPGGGKLRRHTGPPSKRSGFRKYQLLSSPVLLGDHKE